jgi:hypothetical protein
VGVFAAVDGTRPEVPVLEWDGDVDLWREVLV